MGPVGMGMVWRVLCVLVGVVASVGRCLIGGRRAAVAFLGMVGLRRRRMVVIVMPMLIPVVMAIIIVAVPRTTPFVVVVVAVAVVWMVLVPTVVVTVIVVDVAIAVVIGLVIRVVLVAIKVVVFVLRCVFRSIGTMLSFSFPISLVPTILIVPLTFELVLLVSVSMVSIAFVAVFLPVATTTIEFVVVKGRAKGGWNTTRPPHASIAVGLVLFGKVRFHGCSCGTMVLLLF